MTLKKDSRFHRPTPFEERVYAVVRRIPKSQTRSYQWVATQLGDPSRARAVGNALNRNPYAPQVPCHRVIRLDGSLGGFSKGAEVKRRLLDAERREARSRKRNRIGLSANQKLQARIISTRGMKTTKLG